MEERVYFKNVKDLDDLRKQYKKLALKLHPDKGGSHNEFLKMRKEYDEIFSKGFENHEHSRADENKFLKILNELMSLAKIKIEIIGTWIWITGDTKPVRERLKTLGFRWSNNKKAWYYASGLKGKKRGTSSLNKIRSKYGSYVMTPEEREERRRLRSNPKRRKKVRRRTTQTNLF